MNFNLIILLWAELRLSLFLTFSKWTDQSFIVFDNNGKSIDGVPGIRALSRGLGQTSSKSEYDLVFRSSCKHVLLKTHLALQKNNAIIL